MLDKRAAYIVYDDDGRGKRLRGTNAKPKCVSVKYFVYSRQQCLKAHHKNL